MRLLVALLCCVGVQAQAATVFKCVDPSGKITFTQQNCPDNHALSDVIRPRNVAPSGGVEVVNMAMPEDTRPEPQPVSAPSAVRGVTVVGGEKPCSTGMSSRDERTAVVRGEASKGMTRRQIESMYGTPDNTSTANGSVSYRYWSDQNRSYTSVSFDKNGCSDWVYQSQDK